MDGYITIGTELDTKSFDKEIALLESKLQDIEATLQMANEDKTLFSTSEIKQMENEAEKLKNKLVDLYKKQSNIDKQGLKNMSSSLENIGKSVDNVVKKVTRWTLAIFGVRSIYSAIRGAMSTLSQYDEQMATNIEYIRFVLASALKPIIETIINLVYELLRAINYIAQAWFGVNLFANATADAFKKADQNAGKLKKTMFGFDKANILQDSGSTSKGGGVGGVIPSLEFGDGKVPEWIKWIAENKDLVIDGLMGIAGGLIAIKLGLGGIKALGIGMALVGIVESIQKIIDFMNDPTFENFTGILEGISLAVTGVGLAFVSLPVIIAGAIALIITEIIKNYNFIIGKFNELINWFENDFINMMRGIFGPVLGDILSYPFIFAINFVKGAFESFYGGIKEIVDGIVLLFQGDFINGIKKVFSGLKNILLAPLNALIEGINSLIRGINKISIDVPDWIPIVGGSTWGFNIPQIPKLAKGGIINMPGKGVPIGASAIGGEYGAEWIQPLSDESALERVGSAIGKHVKVNVDFTAEIEGRVFARVMKELNNDNNFARNGG